jgi:predicted amidohydrolase
MKLRIATCQFPVDADIRRNLDHALRQMEEAKVRRADVVHFSELCLPGYAEVEFPSLEGLDWSCLEEATRQVLRRARELGLWVILGSTHRLTGRRKPHNSLYIINSRGRIVDRYDKMFCTGPPDGSSGDLKHYSPGDHFTVFRIKGIRCGALICHDFRYPELYREYFRLGVRVMFHSYHNGHVRPAAARKHRRQAGLGAPRYNVGDNVWGITVPATSQGYAANNFMWISATNTSARESAWPSFFVRPDGVITGRLARNRAGILMSEVDTKRAFYDASAYWRDRAMRGVYHSGRQVRDPRSRDRTHP